MRNFKSLQINVLKENITKIGKNLRDYLILINIKDKIAHKKNKNSINYYDTLTELPNNIYFLKRLDDTLREVSDNNKKGAIICIDIDDYKIINNEWGYNLGNLILKKFGQLVNSCLGKNAELVRLSGDEFAILVYEFKHIREINQICDKIYQQLKEPFKVIQGKIHITASMGISIFPDNSMESCELIKFCDFAMYKSKHKGKNTYTIFHNEMSDSYYRKALIGNELKYAINRNELYVCYQPQINALSNKIVGIEALLRWNNRKLGGISPGEFISIAERSGDIVEIGYWTLNRVLRQAQIWKQEGYIFDTISVNISTIQMKKKDFKENLLNICNKYDICPSCLEIEITESIMMDMSKENIELLHGLVEMGINIGIDDFGTGYSSLNYLINIPFNTLKIDKIFVDNIENYKSKVLINEIVNVSKLLNYRVITEGVETEEQIEVLIDLGCNIIQGFYFSKPLQENEIGGLLKAMSNK